MNKKVINNMKKRNSKLSKYACKDQDAVRLFDIDDDFRTPFFRDIDKIIYTLSYARYLDKTQVYTYSENDEISKRITHVQMVSKIARTIGRALNLNEDLIEAASLGHDLGHVPFGHNGERMLNEISLKNNEGFFYHNVQSVRLLMDIENNGYGDNITVQVLDAILCHNGEKLEQIYEPENKTIDEFLKQYNDCYHSKEIASNLKPMTLEGCVVRISDIIAYIGKDIEDAIKLGKLKRENIPKSITDIIGTSNSEIVNSIVVDIIKNSLNKNYIKMSKKVNQALQKLIQFNYKDIYLKANSKERIKEFEKQFNDLFNLYFMQVKNKEYDKDIYTLFLNNMNDKYNNETTIVRKVIDFIAGMTDDFFKLQYEKYFNL